ncbi:MAG TPA: LysR substrate-binding domain-containing protein, partial [Burkholderiaceae bacterium]|nr:LysR substrate-binding domain-containing protein [Burkholderiaceae bacterium]
AARELFVTQPAISREVKTLEAQLGTPLFRRVNRTLQLTEAGEQLYHVVDQALALIDTAAQRLAGSSRTLSLTTTVPLASLWLGPRLAGFTRQHPDIDMRVAASNDVLDLAREHLDLAIRHVLRDASPPSADKLFDHETFPVCSPALARDRKRPLRTAADLPHHVLLEHETVTNGRPWYDWQQWFEAMNIHGARSAGSLRFSHYDQVVQAAIEGSGVAIGKRPHLARELRDGVLVAPLGRAGVVKIGAFYIVTAATAQRDAVDALVAWLHAEARQDEDRSHKPAPPAKRAKRPGAPTTHRDKR